VFFVHLYPTERTIDDHTEKKKEGGKTPRLGLPRAPCYSGRGTGRQAGRMRAGGRAARQARTTTTTTTTKKKKKGDGRDGQRKGLANPSATATLSLSLSLYIVLLVFVVPLLILLLLPRFLSSPLLPFFPYARRSTQMSFRVGGREVCDEGFTRKGDWNRLQC